MLLEVFSLLLAFVLHYILLCNFFVIRSSGVRPFPLTTLVVTWEEYRAECHTSGVWMRR